MQRNRVAQFPQVFFTKKNYNYYLQWSFNPTWEFSLMKQQFFFTSKFPLSSPLYIKFACSLMHYNFLLSSIKKLSHESCITFKIKIGVSNYFRCAYLLIQNDSVWFWEKNSNNSNPSKYIFLRFKHSASFSHLRKKHIF